MQTNMMKLWQTVLGTLMVTSLACGGGSGSGGPGHDGGLSDGGGTFLDGAASNVDVAPSAVDQATSAVDATVRLDQASAVDQGAVGLDSGADADVLGPDSPTTPDVPMQTDLPATPDLPVKNDLPLGPDVVVPTDLPPKLDLPLDQPSTQDLVPLVDVSVTVDVSGQAETPPSLDTLSEIDTTAIDSGSDLTPQILWPDKLTYSPGEQLTANFTNGSTDSGAWIGIFPIAGADTAYRDWDYTGGDTEGTVILYVPSTAETYNLRMFADNGYTKIATSVPFTVVE